MKNATHSLVPASQIHFGAFSVLALELVDKNKQIVDVNLGSADFSIL